MRRHRLLAKPIESAGYRSRADENVPENRLWRSGLPDVGVACANAFVKHRRGRIGCSQPPSLCLRTIRCLSRNQSYASNLNSITRMAKTHLQNFARPFVEPADRTFTKSACPNFVIELLYPFIASLEKKV